MNDWVEHKKLILDHIKRDEEHSKILDKRLRTIETAVVKLTERMGILTAFYGVLGGMLPAVAVLIFMLVKNIQ